METSPSASNTDASVPQSHPVDNAVTHDCICNRAHELFLARNGGPSNAASDWCQAEKELREACDHAPPGTADQSVVEARTKSVRPTGGRR